MADETDALIDHIGWRLWRAAEHWKACFTREMIEAGHPWYAEACSSVLPFIRGKGTRQSEIVRQMGLSKQAVQQLVDDLERENVVERVPDPDDRRGKIVRLVAQGIIAQRDALTIKRKLEDEFRQKLGRKKFARLSELLQDFGPD